MDWLTSGLTKKRSNDSGQKDRKTPLLGDDDHQDEQHVLAAALDAPSSADSSSSTSEFEMVEQQPQLVDPRTLTLNNNNNNNGEAHVPPPPQVLSACDTARELEAAKRQASEISGLVKPPPTTSIVETAEEKKTNPVEDEGFFGFFFGGFTHAAESAAEAVLQRTTQYPPPLGSTETAAAANDPLSSCFHNCVDDEDVVDEEIPSKVPSETGLRGRLQLIGTLLLSQGCIYSTIFVVMASGLILGMAKQLNLLPSIDWDQDMNVAFVGNSYLVVNDVPRILERMSQGHVDQNSCLHAGGSLASILNTGNGMYDRWQTRNALFTIQDSDDNYGGGGGYRDFWDWGFCSVPQLLLGYDEDLENRNLYDDGKNPCLQDQDYLSYLNANIDQNLSWDYVVLADQSKRMAISDARQVSISALVNQYAPLFLQSGAVPVFVDTHAFWSDNSNMTGLTDVPTFQSMIYEGVQEYMQALSEELPERQSPILAPVGLAYLTVYEEDPDLWEKLFLNDAIHSSIYGSYLIGCVLYCTLFGHLPQKDFKKDRNVEQLFSTSRKLMGRQDSYPSFDEAVYLRRVARRVALRGYKPKTLSY